MKKLIGLLGVAAICCLVGSQTADARYRPPGGVYCCISVGTERFCETYYDYYGNPCGCAIRDLDDDSLVAVCD